MNKKNKNTNNETLEWVKIMEDQLHDLIYEISQMSFKLDRIEKVLLDSRQVCKPKHAKEEDEVLSIFSDLIDDLDNVTISIKKNEL